MKALKPVLFIIVLALIGATAGVLAQAKSAQRLGPPGVKTRPLANSQNLEVLLPEAAGYQSQAMPQSAMVTNALPQDTSYGQRIYQADRFVAQVQVVLMGSSRRSIHKPQICLTAQGWRINDASSHVEMVHLDKPVSYDLPVMRLNAVRVGQIDGQTVEQHCIYVYWFVDADRYTAVHSHRMLWMLRDMVFNNVLDRWAYISIFAPCDAGQEDAAFEQVKKLMSATVPEFQLVPTATK